jgi:hypothetical protein
MPVEREISSLNADQLAQLQRAQAAQVKRAPQVDLPNTDELAALLRLLSATWPELDPTPEGREHHVNGVRLSLYALHFYREAIALNDSIAIHAFADEAQRWLKRQEVKRWRDVHMRPFYAAAIVAGINYAAPRRFPWDLALGLALTDRTAEPRELMWREVLRTNKLPAATPYRDQAPPPSPLRLRYGE